MACFNSSPQIINCEIIENTAIGLDANPDVPAWSAQNAYGGGLFASDGSELTVSNSIIRGNSAKGGLPEMYEFPNGGSAYGGGIYADTLSSLSLNSVKITGNTALGTNAVESIWGFGGNGGTAKGGGIYCFSADLAISRISGNYATGGRGGDGVDGAGGGGIASGGGIYLGNTGSSLLTDCNIAGNGAYSGNSGNCPYLAKDGVHAYGGGICILNQNSIVIRNCLIAKNYLKGGSGGWGEVLYDAANGGNAYGGGIYSESDSVPAIQNNTIAENYAQGGSAGSGGSTPGSPGTGYGSGLYCKAGKEISVYNGIVWQNTGAAAQIYPSTLDVSYTDIEGGYTGTGNINADPCFVSGPNGFYYLSQTAAGQTINSPCVDAGSDTAANLNMDSSTTRTDEVFDAEIVDMGFHYGDSAVPVLQVSTPSLSFEAYQGGANPDSQTITIRNLGGQPLNWTATQDANWLIIDVNYGTCPAFYDANTVTVDVNIAGLAAGTHDANIVVSDPCALNSPQTVSVQLNIVSYNIADLDKNFVVDFNDFAIFANQWHQLPGTPSADIAPEPNGDNFVDEADLEVFCENWLDGFPDIPNLVSHWEFDEGDGDIAYDSAGSNNGTVYGAAWTTGKIGPALDFDGLNDYVLVPDDESQQIKTNQITLSAWIWLAADIGSTQKRIICKQQVGAISWGLGLFGGNGYNQLLFHDSDGTTWYNCMSQTALSINQWYHVAVTDDAGEITIYINGLPDETCNEGYGILTQIAAPITIGKTNPDSMFFFNGVLDDVRIYDRALSAEEVQHLYQEEGAEGADSKASHPNPFNGATGVDLNTLLIWSPGKYADSHDVYLGTDYNDVNNADANSAEYMGNFDVTSFDPCRLESNTIYYWRIDEVNDSNSNVWTGDIWTFTTSYYPSSYSVDGGTYISGDIVSLTADDDNFLIIASYGTGSWKMVRTDFNVDIAAGIPARIDLQVRVKKSSSYYMEQKIFIWNYTTSAWDQKDIYNAPGTGEYTRNIAITSGMSNYISNDQLRIRVGGGMYDSFQLSHELVSVNVTW